MSSVGALHVAILLEQLMDEEPKSRKELIEATGLHKDTVSRYIAAMRKRGVVRIDEYRRGKGRQWVAYYTLNRRRKPDAVKPLPIPRHVIVATNYARQKEKAMHRLFAGKPQESKND